MLLPWGFTGVTQALREAPSVSAFLETSISVPAALLSCTHEYGPPETIRHQKKIEVDILHVIAPSRHIVYFKYDCTLRGTLQWRNFTSQCTRLALAHGSCQHRR